ncbi:MAG TPA: adenine deaminase C-terminal domain-containing protein [Candidatus Binatia bacterium]|jgi:adenine deaminase|nr:adenine deaminase C-terminal domain-containing protein [Candidatus Binatia bacterium]
MARSKADIERLIRGALGEIKADLILTGGQLINVYSGEILKGTEIAVIDGRICYVGPSAAHTRGEATRMLDARGLYISPGFIDGHTHIGYFCRPYEYLQAYVPHGTTALVATCDEQATVFGMKGVRLFLDEVEVHPLRVYTMLSMVAPQDPLLCSTESYSQSEVAEALNDPRLLGLGEIVSWLRLIQRDPELLERIEMALQRRKIIHGHTAGAKDQRLCAIAAAGISSCHEPIRESDVLERMRLGYWTMLREGSFRQDLEATLKPVISRGLNTQRLILVTDSMAPDDVASHGHMDFVVRRAIELGLSPMQAIQSVTLNPAAYSGLDQEIGGIAPGRYADIVMLEDLERLKVRSTVIGGELVAEEGNSLVENRAISLPREARNSFGLIPLVSPSAFKIPCSLSLAKIRVMELLNLNITAEKIVEIRPRSGYLEADPKQDLLKVAVFDRHGKTEKAALGFLQGFGARVGAVGTTINLDENTLLVAGISDQDMSRCANILIEAGGGMVVVDRGEVSENIAFPIGGSFSLDPWREVGKGLDRIHRCLRERGSPFLKPIYALLFLTFVTLPSLRITARGLVAAKDRKLVPLLVER